MAHTAMQKHCNEIGRQANMTDPNCVVVITMKKTADQNTGCCRENDWARKYLSEYAMHKKLEQPTTSTQPETFSQNPFLWEVICNIRESIVKRF
jgi:hypothetical protein